jgi:hypothetical protein
MLGSGGAALRSKLKALNQTPSQHVASMMEEPSKWVARSRLPVGSVRRVGEDEAVEGAAESADDDVDEETFDDADFYQVLLKVGLCTLADRKLEENCPRGQTTI